MNICIETKSSLDLFTKQLSTVLFDILDEDGPLVVITDSLGSQYNNNEEIFADAFENHDEISQIIGAVADGHDPLRCEVDGYNVYATQLHVENEGCIYAMVAVCGLKSGAEQCLAEAVLDQIRLVTSMLEKTNNARSAYPIIIDEEQPYVLN